MARQQRPEGSLQEATYPEDYRLDAIADRPETIAGWMLWGLVASGVVAVCVLAVRGGVFAPWLHITERARWSGFILRPSILWGMMGTLFLAFRTVLWFCYRPFAPAAKDDAPALTVIIPAYNEGAMVKKAIYSVIAADYPAGRLEVFAVDDGSTDDTWEYISEAARRYPHLVTPVRFSKNRGKRAALEEGFRAARGEIVVTVDSDSVVERGTLLALAGPFRNGSIGAVAGKVLVYNRASGLIPGMLHVRFVLSFDFLRAVQSTYGTVYCCPGALSAYRRSVVLRVLDAWVNQRFLGVRCTYGEDRALTNFILSAGFDAVYQRTARVHTVVPQTYGKLCRMFLRWDRSYVREVIHFSRILWKRPLWARAISLVDVLITNLRYPVGWASLVLCAVIAFHDPTTIVRLFFAIGIVSSLNMVYYLYNERSWLFPYGIAYSYFSFLTLFWIFPYALITVRRRTWGTR